MVIWLSAGAVSFVVIMLAYTWAIGRGSMSYNEAVYENLVLTNAPHSRQFYTQEGYALTSYGENGLVVDKMLDFDRPRVMFIGDSYVAAKQVSDRHKFTELVEEYWNRRHPDQPLQTLNVGLDGADLRMYLSFGRNMDKVFAPQKVLVMLSAGDFLPLIRDTQLLEQYRASPSLSLYSPEHRGRLQKVVSDSFFRQFFVGLQHQTSGFMHPQGSDADAQAELVSTGTDVLLGHEESVRLQLKLLQDIWGDRLIILYNPSIPSNGQGMPTTRQEDTLIRAANSLGIPVIDLYEPVLSAFLDHNPPRGFQNTLMGTGHYNQSGHEIIATTIVDALENGYLQEPAK